MKVDKTMDPSVFNVTICHFPEVWLVSTAARFVDQREKSLQAITSHAITEVITWDVNTLNTRNTDKQNIAKHEVLF